jgi:hypothetical protein
LFLLAQLAVQAHFFLQLGIELPAPNQHHEPSGEFSETKPWRSPHAVILSVHGPAAHPQK